MDYLYSLYDALVSINVPNDKARAVVDAMERDMGTTIATKADLQFLRQEIRQEMSLLATKAEVAEVRQDIAEVRQDIALVCKDMELLSSRMDGRLDTLSTTMTVRLDTLSTTMTVRLGSMLMVGLGLLFAALKLT